jgi:hypothetical protein
MGSNVAKMKGLNVEDHPNIHANQTMEDHIASMSTPDIPLPTLAS